MFVRTHPTNAGHPRAALHATRLLDELSGDLHLFAFICRLDVFQSGRRKRRAVFWELQQRCLGSHFLPRIWWHVKTETGGEERWSGRRDGIKPSLSVPSCGSKEYKQVAQLTVEQISSLTPSEWIWQTKALVCKNKPVCSNWWINYNYIHLFKWTFDLFYSSRGYKSAFPRFHSYTGDWE